MRPVASDGDRSIGELFGALASETGTLVRQEVTLASTEMAEKARLAARQATLVVLGGFVALAALQGLAAAGVIALAMVLPLWAAALIVGGALAVVATALTWRGIAALRRIDPVPTQTLRSLEENRSWVRNQLQ